MNSLTPLQIKRIGRQTVKVYIPGNRIHMRAEDFYAFWLNQHQEQLIEAQKASGYPDVGDFALVTFVSRPELVEDNHN